jgi:putative glutamate/gamma-aminobutyrate antiporter
MSNQQKNSSSRPLNFFLLAMINVAAICSIRNWPLNAQYGFSSLFFYIAAAIGFFIPSALVSAELASGWPKNGGIYAWVKEAFGHKAGFLAVWLQWVENVVYYPAALSFVAICISYSIDPSLAQNQYFTFFTILLLFWGATFINLQGMKISGLVSSLGVLSGTIVPGLLIIGLGIFWYFSNQPSAISMDLKSFIPDLSGINQLSFLAGTMLGFAGIEMSAAHARDVPNPRKEFPKAIMLSTFIILALSILGTLAIAVAIPQNQINLLSGGIDALILFFKQYHLSFLIPLLSLLIGFGAFSTVLTWIIGPSRALLTAAQDGDLPPILHKTNSKQMPVSMLVLQGIIVTFLATVFLVLPDVSSSFWVLIALASILYSAMYVIMFITAIKLRYSQPNVERPYKIGLGNAGMWVVSTLGSLVSLFVIVVGFLPPDHIVNKGRYVTILLSGFFIFLLTPFFILMFKNPNWNVDKDKVTEGEVKS